MNIVLKVVSLFSFCFFMFGSMHANTVHTNPVFIALTDPEIKRFFSQGIETPEDIQVLRKIIKSMVTEDMALILAKRDDDMVRRVFLFLLGCTIVGLWNYEKIKALITVIDNQERAARRAQ